MVENAAACSMLPWRLAELQEGWQGARIYLGFTAQASAFTQGAKAGWKPWHHVWEEVGWKWLVGMWPFCWCCWMSKNLPHYGEEASYATLSRFTRVFCQHPGSWPQVLPFNWALEPQKMSRNLQHTHGCRERASCTAVCWSGLVWLTQPRGSVPGLWFMASVPAGGNKVKIVFSHHSIGAEQGGA